MYNRSASFPQKVHSPDESKRKINFTIFLFLSVDFTYESDFHLKFNLKFNIFNIASAPAPQDSVDEVYFLTCFECWVNLPKAEPQYKITFMFLLLAPDSWA